MEPDIRTDPYRNNKDKIYVISIFPNHFWKSGKPENQLKKAPEQQVPISALIFSVAFMIQKI